MVKFLNRTGAAVKVTEKKTLATTTLQDGEELKLNAETDEILVEAAPTP